MLAASTPAATEVSTLRRKLELPPVEDPRFTVIDDVVAPGDPKSPGSHVVDYEVQKILSEGWQGYVAILREQVPEMPVPVVRQITTSFEAECHAGDRLQRGTRVVSRSRRSYVLEEALWQTDSEQVIATSKVVMTGIDRTTGRAAELPPELVSAMEALEGVALPISGRTQEGGAG